MSVLPDQYVRKARLYVTVLLVLPAALAVVCVAGETVLETSTSLGKVAAGSTLVGLVVGSLLMLAEQVARAGRKQQPYLFHKWGGPPLSEAIHGRGDLEHRESWQRIRQFLADQVGGEAGNDPKSRDLESELKELTRDKAKFGMVFHENCNFGFRRNLYGVKPWGFGSAATAIVVGGLFLFSQLGQPQSAVLPWLTLIVGLVALLLWSCVTPMFVRHAASAYVDAMQGAGLTLIRDHRKSDSPQASSDDKVGAT
ncbi:MAG: hypothetical protein WD468_12880 [Pirellulales bacterium]